MNALGSAFVGIVDAALDERYRRRHLRLGVWGRRVGDPFLASENIVSTYEGGTNLLAERYGGMLGVEDLWVNSAAARTGSFKDLGRRCRCRWCGR
jgi:hypothetical protein